jgi:CRP-like cAMP-binding protein
MEATSDLTREVFKPGDYIFFEGDIDFHFYIVESGEVQIFTKTKDGKRMDLLTLTEGESFGEFALMDRVPRSASAQAMTETTVIKVSEKGYEQLLSELPAWASSMLRSLVNRLRHNTDLLKTMPQFPRKR